MFSPTTIIGLRPLVIASAMLLCWSFAPSQAMAGCGDYNMPDHHNDLDKLVKDHGKTPGKPRCHGPNCSQSPLAPVPLREAPTRVVSAENDLSIFEFETSSFVVASRLLPTDQQDQSPAGLASVIYHPPR